MNESDGIKILKKFLYMLKIVIIVQQQSQCLRPSNISDLIYS